MCLPKLPHWLKPLIFHSAQSWNVPAPAMSWIWWQPHVSLCTPFTLLCLSCLFWKAGNAGITLLVLPCGFVVVSSHQGCPQNMN